MTRTPAGPARAGIIAAGRGDRLRHGAHLLKPLVPVAGRALIDHVLSSVGETAPAEVVIIVNEASLAVRDHVAARDWPFAVQWIVETTPSSMHSFLRVLEALAPDGPDNKEGPFLMSTVDTIAPPGAYGAFFDASRALEADVSLALARPGDDEKPLLVRLATGSTRIEAMGEQARRKRNPGRHEAPAPGEDTDLVAGNDAELWATAGYYVVRPTVLREAGVARKEGLSALRTFFTNLLARGYRLNGVPVAGAVDVDRPGDVQVAEAFLKQVGA